MKIQTLLNIVQSKFAALRYPYYRTKAKISLKKPKIKLVAIAKNESAYLPEWVYHHLYFGFDHIDIYYNGCTDNTLQVAGHIDDKRVSFFNGDPVFSSSKISPQMDIYRPQFAKARKQGFDHLMFLDIDEFWLPLDLTSSIKDFIRKVPVFDSMSFQWANKVDESEAFSAAISPIIQVEPARQLKSLHKSYITPGLMNPHNVIDNSLIRVNADGSTFVPSNVHQSMAPEAVLPERAFILHRKYRSQVEYVALLGRGRPIGPEKTQSLFKNNREGYYVKDNMCEVAFDETAYATYRDFMDNALAKFHNSYIYEESKASVIARHNEVIDAIRNAPEDELYILNRILKNVDIGSVQEAFRDFKQRVGQDK